MSDTPRTDAAVVYMAHVAGVDPEFARALELKLQVAERSARQWEATALLYAQNSEHHQRQLAEARKDAERYRYLRDHSWDDAFDNVIAHQGQGHDFDALIDAALEASK